VAGDAWADVDLPVAEVRAAADVAALPARIGRPAAVAGPRSANARCATRLEVGAWRVEAPIREVRPREEQRRGEQHREVRHREKCCRERCCREEQRRVRPQGEVPRAADSCCRVVRLGSPVAPAWRRFDRGLRGWPRSW
jgi:hypothetical protein